MSDDKKPVDLVAARTLADGLDVFDMPGTAEMMRDMADEIEAMRKASALLLKRLKFVALGVNAEEAAAALATLLPPS